jgi:hypothetical protein
MTKALDALSYMLATIELRTAIYATIWLRPPWGVRIPRANASAFHAVLSGRCWFRLDDEQPPKSLGAGNVVVLPHGHAHTFCDNLRSPVRTIDLSRASAPANLPKPPRDARVNDPRPRRFSAATSDPKLGAALALIHERPGAPWTIGKLASEVGMSRSAFAVRFTSIVDPRHRPSHGREATRAIARPTGVKRGCCRSR